MPSLEVRWIIHSTFLVTYKDEEQVNILIDPFLEPLGEEKNKILNELKDLDLLLITHSHFDHMANACEILKLNKKIKYLSIFEIMNHIKENCKIDNEGIGMNIGGTWTFNKNNIKVDITMIQSTHSSDIGAPTGFIIRFPQFHVYHPGDTGLFADMKLLGELYRIDLSLLPIGGHFTMGIEEAVKAVELLKTKYAIPMHYKTFPIIDADPQKFKEKVESNTDTKVIILDPKESHLFKI